MTVQKLIKLLRGHNPKALVAVAKQNGGIRLVSAVVDTPVYYDGSCLHRLPLEEVEATPKNGAIPETVVLTVMYADGAVPSKPVNIVRRQ